MKEKNSCAWTRDNNCLTDKAISLIGKNDKKILS